MEGKRGTRENSMLIRPRRRAVSLSLAQIYPDTGLFESDLLNMAPKTLLVGHLRLI